MSAFIRFFSASLQALEEDASAKSSLYDYCQISPCAFITCIVGIWNRKEKITNQMKKSTAQVVSEL